MVSVHVTSAPVRWLSLTEEFNVDHLDFYGQELEDESALRKPLGFMKWFTDVDECIDYLTDVQDSFIVLTISGRFAWRVVPYIHDFSLLTALYIFCKPESEERNKKWSANYPKVIRYQ